MTKRFHVSQMSHRRIATVRLDGPGGDIVGLAKKFFRDGHPPSYAFEPNVPGTELGLQPIYGMKSPGDLKEAIAKQGGSYDDA